MDGFGAPGHLLGGGDGPVGRPGPGDDEQVGGVEGPVGGGGAEGADHPQIHGVAGGQQPQTHHGGDHRDAGALAQGQQLLLGPRAEQAAAHAQEGAVGGGDGLGHLFDLQLVALDAGLIAPDVHRIGVFGLDHLLLDIHGDVDEDGPLPAGGGDVEGLLYHSGDVVGVLDQIAVLDKGGHGAGDVHLLKDVPAQQIALHLAGDGHQGDGVHIGGGDAGDEVGGARPGGDHTNAGLARHAGVAGGHVAGVLLRADQGIGDVRVGQGVHRRADGGSRIAEYVVHMLPFQTFHQCLGSADHAAFLLDCLIWSGRLRGKKQKDLVPHRTKSHSVVPPKFAAAGRALVIPITEGIRLRLLCSAQRLPGDFCLEPHESSQRPLPLCACGTRLLTRSLPFLNVINCNHTAEEFVCQLEKTAILPFLRFRQEAGKERRNILIGCPKNKWSRKGGGRRVWKIYC